ncbi:MAG: AAA family ATPase [PVC group bacterium]|nr:AAA family ATPase [PVC group bacterium]
MILNISKLNKIGMFDTFSQEKNFQYGGKGQNCNIVFGFNGSGKTTISNCLALFSDSTFVSEEEKSEIYGDLKYDNNSQVVLGIQGNSQIEYPASRQHSKPFYIFNRQFVSTHVYDGSFANMKRFANAGGELKNKEIDRLDKLIEALDTESNSLVDKNQNHDKEHAKITKNLSGSFGKSLTDRNKSISKQKLLDISLPTKKLNELESQKETLVLDYQLSKRQSELESDIKELQKVAIPSLNLDLPTLNTLLQTSTQQLSKDVLQRKIDDIQSLFEEDNYKQGVERWFRLGKKILDGISVKDNSLCPLCDTDITNRISRIMADYEAYFDDAYEQFSKDLKEQAEVVEKAIKSTQDAMVTQDLVMKIRIKYPHVFKDDLTVFKFSNFVDIIQQLHTSLKSKMDNIQEALTIPEHMSNQLISLTTSMDELVIIVEKTITALRARKLDSREIEDQIRSTYKEIMILEFNQTEPTGAVAKYKNNAKRMNEIMTIELPNLKLQLSEQVAKLRIESKSISKFLKKMGIDHFDININENEDGNIIIYFKGNNEEKTKMRNCLSEGEKTALAFAYFLSKFENEVRTKDEIERSVIVIDDPISSLDDNRLYSTAMLIRSNFDNVHQILVLSHNFLFLKYYNSFYRGRANCVFLNHKKLTELPKELQNFETPYYYMLAELLAFLDKENQEVTYVRVKKHLPNYIRRILETFLSFKFSSIVNRTGGYRSPGLKDFDKNFESTDIDCLVMKQLKENIVDIDGICDAHSHGNALHTQENYYISETDLRLLSQKAISVIESMDRLHLTSFTPD